MKDYSKQIDMLIASKYFPLIVSVTIAVLFILALVIGQMCPQASAKSISHEKWSSKESFQQGHKKWSPSSRRQSFQQGYINGYLNGGPYFSLMMGPVAAKKQIDQRINSNE